MIRCRQAPQVTRSNDIIKPGCLLISGASRVIKYKKQSQCGKKDGVSGGADGGVGAAEEQTKQNRRIIIFQC